MLELSAKRTLDIDKEALFFWILICERSIAGYILRFLVSQNLEYNYEQHRKTLIEKHNFPISRKLVCKCRNERNRPSLERRDN